MCYYTWNALCIADAAMMRIQGEQFYNLARLFRSFRGLWLSLCLSHSLSASSFSRIMPIVQKSVVLISRMHFCWSVMWSLLIEIVHSEFHRSIKLVHSMIMTEGREVNDLQDLYCPRLHLGMHSSDANESVASRREAGARNRKDNRRKMSWCLTRSCRLRKKVITSM